jgi:hypothetical protein
MHAYNPLGVLFIVVIGYSIYRSKSRIKTVLYALMAAVLVIVFGFLLSSMLPVFNNSATGAASVDVSLLVAVLVAFVHSRRSKNHPLNRLGDILASGTATRLRGVW